MVCKRHPKLCYIFDTIYGVEFNVIFSLKAEARAEFAERSVQKLQKEVDRLEGIFRFIICVYFII